MSTRAGHGRKTLCGLLLGIAAILLSTRFNAPSGVAHAEGEPPPTPAPAVFEVQRSDEPTPVGGGSSIDLEVSRLVVVVDDNPDMRGIQVPAAPALQAAMGNPAAATATFTITYKANGTSDPWGAACQTFPTEAMAAFDAAAAIWANTIQSSVPIRISACWSNLGSPTVLGYSGALDVRDFGGAPLANTWYRFALADALHGSDLDPAYADDYITYNSGFSWYYGTDGYPPPGQFDLVTVAAHEIAHGLNFAGTASYSGGTGTLGSSGSYNIYDTFMESPAGTKLTTLTGTALGSALTSNDLWFNGANANAANGGGRVRMYAPSTWAQGSSYSHLNYSTFAGTANSMMVYAVAPGSSQHNPGPVTTGLLEDLGWPLGSPAAPEIDVRGNGNSIASGDTTPSTTDGTDFGSATVGGSPVSHSGFAVYNTGTANLTLTGSPYVAVSGTNAADFSVSPQPTSPIGAGGNSSFTVSFQPGGTGMRTATLTILNNDPDEGTYTFAIQGSGTAPPAPDLTIAALIPSPSPAYTNDDILVEVDVENGGAAAGGFYVDVYVDRAFTGCGDEGDYWTGTSGLDAGSSGQAYIVIPAGELSVGSHDLRAYVDTDCTVSEGNETNNEAGPVSLTVATAPAPPTHDDFDAPKVITSLAYSDSALTSGATRAGDDPDNIPGCYPGSPEEDLAAGMASVWYQYTPPTDTTLVLDTVGSGYDTYIAVWSGTRGSLTPVACNDDIELYTVTTSRLRVDLTGGTTYHFEIAEWTWSSYWYTDGAAAILPAIAGRGQDRAGTINATKEGSIAPIEEAAAGSLQFHVRSAVHTKSDFDSDGSTDPAVFQRATGHWFVIGSTDGFFTPALSFGNDAAFIPVPGDYDGDGATDAAVFQRTTGNWFAVGSTDGFFTPALGFGNDTDYIPVPGDYDGDGKTDAAVFQKATGHWFVVGSTDGFFTPALSFGNDTDYIPVPGDYDGDGKTDAAVFQKATGNWFVVGSTDGFFTPALSFGNDAGFIPVPGDYDGDGKTDPAVFQKATGHWFVVGSTDGFFTPALSFGSDTGYIPQQGDYDGDGKTDAAVFEKSSGNWFVVGSTDGFFTPALGFGNDADYIPVVK